MTGAVPHDWLFPHMAAVVHHGGAGTTGGGLRAGKPSIICPFLGDQPFWGKVIHQQGLGPKPIPQWELSADRPAKAIREAVEDPEIGRRAEKIGEKIRSEDGVGCAVGVIESVLNPALTNAGANG